MCPIKTEAPTEYKKAIEADGEFRKVPLDPRVPNRAMYIGTEIGQEEQAELLAFPDKNSDIFAWSTSNLVGVSKEVIEHKMHVVPRLRKMSEEKVEAGKAEVQRLLDAGFIREVTYPQWLANMAMVQKKERNVVNVYRFHGPKQVLHQRRFPPHEN
jgi:hypothetical protein